MKCFASSGHFRTPTQHGLNLILKLHRNFKASAKPFVQEMDISHYCCFFPHLTSSFACFCFVTKAHKQVQSNDCGWMENLFQPLQHNFWSHCVILTLNQRKKKRQAAVFNSFEPLYASPYISLIVNKISSIIPSPCNNKINISKTSVHAVTSWTIRHI